MKYGTHIWVVCEDKNGVYVFDDYISDIVVYKNDLYYGLEECCEEVKEENIILYEDKDHLYEVICEKMKKVRKNNNE